MNLENWKINSKKIITTKYPPRHCPKCGTSDTDCHVWYLCQACRYEWREGEEEIMEQAVSDTK